MRRSTSKLRAQRTIAEKLDLTDQQRLRDLYGDRLA